MNESQKMLRRSMDEYEELLGELPPLYCVTVWTRDRENVNADLKVLARKAARESLKIEPLCIMDYFFKHRSDTDANLPISLVLDPFTQSFYNVGIYFFIESENQDDHQIMRSKSSERFHSNATSREERRVLLKTPLSKFAQFATQIYPQLVHLNPFPFFPLLDESQALRLVSWKLALLLMRLSLESPEQFGSSNIYVGLGRGLPPYMHEKAIEKLVSELRPKYAQGFPNVVVTLEDMVSNFWPSGVAEPRKDWPLELDNGNLVWQQPMIVSVLRQDLLSMLQPIIKEVASSPNGLVPLPVNTEEAQNFFLKEGSHFIIRFREGKKFQLKASRGLGYIWVRLQYPREPFSAEDLMGDGKKRRAVQVHDALPNTVSEFKNEGIRGSSKKGTKREQVTPEDRRKGSNEYKQRQSELQQAKPSRAKEIREEMEWFRKYYGLTKTGEIGILRKERTPAQKRTEAVSKAIKEALVKIKQEDPALASYLAPLAIYREEKFDSSPTEMPWVLE